MWNAFRASSVARHGVARLALLNSVSCFDPLFLGYSLLDIGYSPGFLNSVFCFLNPIPYILSPRPWTLDIPCWILDIRLLFLSSESCVPLMLLGCSHLNRYRYRYSVSPSGSMSLSPSVSLSFLSLSFSFDTDIDSDFDFLRFQLKTQNSPLSPLPSFLVLAALFHALCSRRVARDA